MMWVTQTHQGDTWDNLALYYYGSEKLAYLLLQANPKYMHYIFLPAGLDIYIPQTPKNKLRASRPAPPWIDK